MASLVSGDSWRGRGCITPTARDSRGRMRCRQTGDPPVYKPNSGASFTGGGSRRQVNSCIVPRTGAYGIAQLDDDVPVPDKKAPPPSVATASCAGTWAAANRWPASRPRRGRFAGRRWVRRASGCFVVTALLASLPRGHIHLGRRAVRAMPLSDHAIRLNFDYSTQTYTTDRPYARPTRPSWKHTLLPSSPTSTPSRRPGKAPPSLLFLRLQQNPRGEGKPDVEVMAMPSTS